MNEEISPSICFIKSVLICAKLCLTSIKSFLVPTNKNPINSYSNSIVFKKICLLSKSAFTISNVDFVSTNSFAVCSKVCAAPVNSRLDQVTIHSIIFLKKIIILANFWVKSVIFELASDKSLVVSIHTKQRNRD